MNLVPLEAEFQGDYCSKKPHQ